MACHCRNRHHVEAAPGEGENVRGMPSCRNFARCCEPFVVIMHPDNAPFLCTYPSLYPMQPPQSLSKLIRVASRRTCGLFRAPDVCCNCLGMPLGGRVCCPRGLLQFVHFAPSTNASTLVRPSWRRDSLVTLERVLAPARKMGRGAHGRECTFCYIRVTP